MLASQQGLAAIYFPAQTERIESLLAPLGLQKGHGNMYLLQAEAFLACYFDGDLEYSPGIALDCRGTPFQLAVWHALSHIPPGKRLSYAGLAEVVGHRSAVRAVAGAVARNPLSILVPCHRVVAADGSLRGYAAGVHIKRLLLDHEDRHRARPEALSA